MPVTKRKTVTQQQIANKARVSLATVSAVLSGKANLRRIGPETVHHVWEVSRKLGYTANPRTAVLTVRSIGIILRSGVRNSLANPFYGEIYQGIEEVLSREDFHPIFSNPLNNTDESAGVPRVVAQGKVAGIILLGQLPREYVKRLRDLGTPLVCVNFDFDSSVTSVVIDSERENLQAMEFLHEQHHTRVAYMTANSGTQLSLGLEQGYRKSLSAGVEPCVIKAAGADLEHGQQAIRSFLESNPGRPLPFTCLLAENDGMATGAILALNEAGIKVPDDLSVMGAHDFVLPIPLKLTTTFVDKVQMGRIAAQQLITILHDPGAPAVRVTMPTRVIARSSVKDLKEITGA